MPQNGTDALSLKNYFHCLQHTHFPKLLLSFRFTYSFIHSFVSHSFSLCYILRDDVTPFFPPPCLCVVNRAFQVKGRIVTYFMGLRRRPLTVFGIFLSIVISLILLTICISTILYCNAVKKSRINPESNYIKVVRRIKT